VVQAMQPRRDHPARRRRVLGSRSGLITAIELSALLDAMPFARHCGMELVTATPDEVEGRLEWAEELCTANGRLHGGALMTLADTVGAACGFLNRPDGASTTTIESKTNFMRAVDAGAAIAVARPLQWEGGSS
jgi:1,4-dihydroxy-2-naphthoyl-CoA hydrolase